MVAEQIKALVTMDMLLSHYGIDKKRGFVCCPFHIEKTPSMKIYKNSYHCFGCGANGSVIDFVMNAEKFDFSTACRTIDNIFSLGLYSKPSFTQLRRTTDIIKRNKERKDKLALAQNSYDKALKAFVENDIKITFLRPTTENSEHMAEYMQALSERSILEIQLEQAENKMWEVEHGRE